MNFYKIPETLIMRFFSAVFSVIIMSNSWGSPLSLDRIAPDFVIDKDTTCTKHHKSSSLGLKIGLGSSNFYGGDWMINPGADNKNRIGLLIGGSLNVYLNKYFDLSFDFLYNQKGRTIIETMTYLKTTEKFKLNYLDLPIRFVYKIPSRTEFKPRIFFGPVFSWIHSAEDLLKIEDRSTSQDTTLSATVIAYPNDFGFICGIGGCEKFDVTTVSVEIQYSRWFNSISPDIPAPPPSAYNWQIAIVIGLYMFI
jgi:hypothetical protein